jgi:hypothetical protein
MTVKQLLDTFPKLDKVSFIHDNCVIETIDCSADYSFRDIRKHYDEKVFRVFAMAEDEIRIDSK